MALGLGNMLEKSSYATALLTKLIRVNKPVESAFLFFVNGEAMVMMIMIIMMLCSFFLYTFSSYLG